MKRPTADTFGAVYIDMCIVVADRLGPFSFQRDIPAPKPRVEPFPRFAIALDSKSFLYKLCCFCRLSSAASTDEKAQWKELIQQYTAKGRCAVFPHNEMEYYLMPPIQLTRALLLSAGDRRLPARNLLLACVHPKVPFVDLRCRNKLSHGSVFHFELNQSSPKGGSHATRVLIALSSKARVPPKHQCCCS